MAVEALTAHRMVMVDTFTDGVLRPDEPMLGPVEDGGHIVFNTAPGCWGPMITPAIRGGHEVARPVAVAGAEVGDAIAIRIQDIVVTSIATASGNDVWVDGAYNGDPYCARRCPGCGTEYPETRLEGIGQEAVRCVNCGADATPFKFTNGYTIAFDEQRRVGVTLPRGAAEDIARDAAHYAALPESSVQHPILTFAPHDLVALATRLRPFMGQLGTTPSIAMPDSHNAGDFGSFLVGAPHQFAITAEDLERHRTDGHMDIDAVRAGAILICPVKVPGGGVYMGDMHALQGDGEIAGHTCDVSGTVTLEVEVVKGLGIDGPVLLPVPDDLPFLARPLDAEERRRAEALARQWGLDALEETAPISVVGSGPDLNSATDNGLARAAALLDMTVPEVKNRATITGAIEIGRHPGVVQVTFRAPLDRLEARGLLPYVEEQYLT
ncbi:MAG: acetamidase/formamidase family protein [Actinobacteria bacterium]|nr:MAG: acetamidase/formamidase family protein [Actinomycetota bacterium]